MATWAKIGGKVTRHCLVGRVTKWQSDIYRTSCASKMSNICAPGGHDIGHGHDIWRAEEGDAGSNGGKRGGVHEVKMSNQALLEIFEGLSNEPMVTWPSVFCQQVCIFIKISEIKCMYPTLYVQDSVASTWEKGRRGWIWIEPPHQALLPL